MWHICKERLIKRGHIFETTSFFSQYSSPYAEYGQLSKKFSSCSTIFIDDSTVSQPNLKNTIKAVALAVFFHIRNRQYRERDQLEGRLLDIFDEKLHPLSVRVSTVNYLRCYCFQAGKWRAKYSVTCIAIESNISIYRWTAVIYTVN